MTESHFQLFKTTADRLCNLGAIAVKRYAEISNLNINTNMPEHFIQSYVLEHYGAIMTMETKLSDLMLVGKTLQSRHQQEMRSHNPRIDLVLYHDDKKEVLALIEMKSGYISNDDRDKLLGVLPLVNCSVGIACGWFRDDQLEHERGQYKARKAENDYWGQTPFTVANSNLFFAAHAFGVPVVSEDHK